MPFLNLKTDMKICKDVNDYIYDYAVKTKPDMVVLSAKWSKTDWKIVIESIAQLRKAGIKNIVLVGPVPEWEDTLPRQLYRAYRQSGFRSVPYRMKSGLNPDFFDVDAQMAAFAKSQSVTYVSPQSILCNAEGCITRFGETGDMLSTWDDGHLTGVASEYVVSKFPKPAE